MRKYNLTRKVDKQFPNAARRELELKGKSDRVIAWEIGHG